MKKNPSMEYKMLQTSALCLVAFGVVMVFSASSTTMLLGESGDATQYLKKTLIFGAAGIAAMVVLSSRGLATVRRATPLIVGVSIFLLLVTLIPGVAPEVNGARRWIDIGPVRVQASELAKFALVLYAAHLFALRPKIVTRFPLLVPYMAVCALVCLLVVIEPDLGSAMVIPLAVGALMLVAGVPARWLAMLAGAMLLLALIAVLIEPYRQARITSFLNPSADASGAGFQGIQASIALGSGGLFGVGLGESVQKLSYLPEAHTDMIAAVIGEETGLVGLGALMFLYTLLGYAGLRTAQRARDRYTTLLATGLTAMLMVQAAINLFAVLGLAPLTGIPLPFVSYGNSSLIISLACIGILLNIASGGRAPAPAPATGPSRGRSGVRARLRVVDGGRQASPVARPRPATGQARAKRSASASAKGRNSRGGNRGARGPGPGHRRRASG